MNDAFIYIVGFLLLCAAVYYLFFSKKAVVLGRLAKTPLKKTGDVKDDEVVKLKGKVVYAGRVMTAPLSKRKCVYYHVTVKNNSNNHGASGSYLDIDVEKAADVVIFDGEHYAVIDTRLVAAYILQDESQQSGFWNISTPELKEFLVKQGERPTDAMGWSREAYAREGVLEEGETLTVVGKARWKNASTLRFKLPVDKVLYVSAMNEQGVYFSDDPYA